MNTNASLDKGKDKDSNYWYTVTVNKNGMASQRQGNVRAPFGYEALERVKLMAREWGPVMHICVYAIKQDGTIGHEIVSQSNIDQGGSSKREVTRVKVDEPKPYSFGTCVNFPAFPTLKLEGLK